MATIVIGVDKNLSPDEDYAFQNAVGDVLEKAGHTVEKLEREPNAFATYSYEGKASGKIGIYLIAAGTYSIADFYYGAASGGGSFKYAYFGIRGDLGLRPHNKSEFESSSVGADADCPSELCAHIAGKTFPEINNQLKDKCQAIFGASGQEMGKNILAAMGGEVDSSSSDTSSTGSTIKEALKKAVSGWDGDAEIRVEKDTVYVNKIKDPTKTKLVINEFANVQYDSVTITDINPKTTNKLTCNYKDYKLTLQDDLLIKRFGENAETIEVDEFVKNYNDAVSFLQRAWNKIRRDDGRQVELKVDGKSKWKTGRWARVYLPSFYIDDYMYISRMSADEDGSTPWTTSLTLLDYPPSFGTYEEESTEESVEDAETLNEEGGTT